MPAPGNDGRAKGKPEYVSDLVVDAMNALGIEYIALNPGASVRALHDSIVQYAGDHPQMILCCHEEIAVSVAIGYAHAKHKPMAVLVHDIVGLQHATKAIYEAWLERTPVVILGGTGPMDIDKRRPWLDWIHTANTTAELVRGYVKWDDQPQGVAAAVESLIRAYRISTTQPQGPVYLCYDLMLQEEKVGREAPSTSVDRFRTPSPPQADEQAITLAAKKLCAATNPVILAEQVGRTREGFNNLVEFANLLAIPVIDQGSALNFPNNSPLDVTGENERVLKESDLVLALDVLDVERGLKAAESSQSRETRLLVDEKTEVINIGLNDYATRAWSSDYRRLFPADVAILADAASALVQLIQKCKSQLNPSMKSAISARRSEIEKIHEGLRKAWEAEAKNRWGQRPTSTARLAAELWQAVEGEEWILTHGSLSGWVRRLWTLTDPGRYLGSGLGTGCGVGESIGVALAHRGSRSICVSIINDGDTLYTPSSLWTAARYEIPTLFVMFNNRSYYQDEGHQVHMAKERGRNTSRVGIGIRIEEPAPSFAKLAESFGIRGAGPESDPDRVGDELKRGIAYVKSSKKPYLLDTVTQPR